MYKYKPLAFLLSHKKKKKVELFFHEIEMILIDNLPKSAYTNKGWWSNNSRIHQARSWLDGGWRVDEIDLKREFVVFKRKK